MIKDEDELIGWAAIAKHIGVSRITATKIVNEKNGPIIWLGGQVFTTEQKLNTWTDHLFNKGNYSLVHFKYLVTMHRWSDTENHSYPIGIFKNFVDSTKAGDEERKNRGGKYDYQIWALNKNGDVTEHVITLPFKN